MRAYGMENSTGKNKAIVNGNGKAEIYMNGIQLKRGKQF